MPAGYVTTYNVTGSAQTLTFVTIRLAGHSERPLASLCLRTLWLSCVLGLLTYEHCILIMGCCVQWCRCFSRSLR